MTTVCGPVPFQCIVQPWYLMLRADNLYFIIVMSETLKVHVCHIIINSDVNADHDPLSHSQKVIKFPFVFWFYSLNIRKGVYYKHCFVCVPHRRVVDQDNSHVIIMGSLQRHL